jgi:ribosomal protein S18 acetylase RimI-like enzyme
MKINFANEPAISADEFADILKRSTLGERRPVDDIARLEGMVRQADVIVTARNPDGLLIGISRAISDLHYCTYLSDLAVDVDYQRQGIGKQLIRETHEIAGLQTSLILLSAPAARSYYPHIGMQQHDSCWIIPGDS